MPVRLACWLAGFSSTSKTSYPLSKCLLELSIIGIGEEGSVSWVNVFFVICTSTRDIAFIKTSLLA